MKYCRIHNYLYNASTLHKIKMMSCILVYQYLQSEVNSQYCIQNKDDSASNAMDAKKMSSKIIMNKNS